MKRIHEIPLEDRPRERLLRLGPSTLTDQELLAVMLGSGGSKGDVLVGGQMVPPSFDLSAIVVCNLK